MIDKKQNTSSSPGPSNDNLNNNDGNNNIDAKQKTLNNKTTSDVNMFKEICDVDDETSERLLRESGGDLEAAIHQFFFSRDYPEVLENQNNQNNEELLRHRRPHHSSPVFGEINEEISAHLNQNQHFFGDQHPPLPVYIAPPRQLTWMEMFRALVLLPFRLFYWTFTECINFFYHFLIGPPQLPAIGNQGQNRLQPRDHVNVVQDRILMNEQQNEYDRALAIDRQKAQERKRLEQQRLDNEKRINEAIEFARARTERLSRRREEIKASENDDPNYESQSSEIIRIRITFPTGTRTEGLFRQNDSLERLFNTVFVHPECPEHFSLVTNFPVTRLNCEPDWYLNEFKQKDDLKDGAQNGIKSIKTFAEHGFSCSAVVMVQDEDA